MTNRISHAFAVSFLMILAACNEKEAVSLETVRAERGELTETVTATGTIESVTQVDVGTQVTGIIDKLYADYNSVVTKGQLIAEIEKTLLQSDLSSAEANVESALNSLSTLVGDFPGALTALSDTVAYHRLDLRQIVPVGVPLDLLRRRPDLAEAEFTVASSAAALGMAKKDYLPSLTIDGSIGFASHSLKDFGKKNLSNGRWPLPLRWTVFDRGSPVVRL